MNLDLIFFFIFFLNFSVCLHRHGQLLNNFLIELMTNMLDYRSKCAWTYLTFDPLLISGGGEKQKTRSLTHTLPHTHTPNTQNTNTHINKSFVKGQVPFLKLCLLVVCLALIIPRITLFFLLTTVFRPKNAFICLCQRSLFLPVYAGTAIVVMVFWL